MLRPSRLRRRYLAAMWLVFFVALQLGPMSLFLVRTTLRSGWLVPSLRGPRSTSQCRKQTAITYRW